MVNLVESNRNSIEMDLVPLIQYVIQKRTEEGQRMTEIIKDISGNAFNIIF
jgi:hypothetical protein